MGVDRHGIRTGFSMNWHINQYDNINASVGYDEYILNNQGSTDQQINACKGFNLLSNTFSILNSKNSSNEHSTDIGLSYKKTFKKE